MSVLICVVTAFETRRIIIISYLDALMSRSILTLTIPPGIPGVNKIFVHKCPGAGKKLTVKCPGAWKKLCPGVGNFASDVVNCFNIRYSGGTRRISDTFNTF